MPPNATYDNGSTGSQTASSLRATLLEGNVAETGEADVQMSSRRSSLSDRVSHGIRDYLKKRRDSLSDHTSLDGAIAVDESKRDFDPSLLCFTDAEVIFYSLAIGVFCG
eukprot:scaffold372064_cov41-Prasinocladus_malaysianus.AAC.2